MTAKGCCSLGLHIMKMEERGRREPQDGILKLLPSVM
jgi:hypothetical protein